MGKENIASEQTVKCEYCNREIIMDYMGANKPFNLRIAMAHKYHYHIACWDYKLDVFKRFILTRKEKRNAM